MNAVLNGGSAVFLSLGYFFIKNKKVTLHRISMVLAFLISILFLVSYLLYHAQHGVTHFAGTGWIRSFYLSLLFTHTILAAVVPPLAVVTLWHALHHQFDRHKRLARWTWPLWMYVSVTGVVIYVMLGSYGGYRTAPASSPLSELSISESRN
jgi:putative membrane protein